MPVFLPIPMLILIFTHSHIHALIHVNIHTHTRTLPISTLINIQTHSPNIHTLYLLRYMPMLIPKSMPIAISIAIWLYTYLYQYLYFFSYLYMFSYTYVIHLLLFISFTSYCRYSTQYTQDIRPKPIMEGVYENEHRLLQGGKWQKNENMPWTDVVCS